MATARDLFKQVRAVKTFFRALHRAYRSVESSSEGKRVLADIHGFCTASLADSNPFEMARNVGRFEVWLHIKRRLEYDENQVADLVSYERDNRLKENA